MLLHDDPAHAFMPYPPVPVPCAGTGPLSGLTFGVKDLFDIAGYPPAPVIRTCWPCPASRPEPP